MNTKHGTVVQAPRFSDQIYGLLREELKSGKIMPGAHVTETQLAARFGVSRTPVREALMQLRREGLLVGRSTRGTACIDQEQGRQREEARDISERALAGLAASRAGLEQRRALGQALQAARDAVQAGDAEAFAAAGARFCAELRVMADNPVLAGFAASLEDGIGSARGSAVPACELARLTKLYSIVQGAAVLASAPKRARMTA